MKLTGENGSYGFGPGGSAHEAWRQSHWQLKGGLRAVCRLRSWPFDTMVHDQLMACGRMGVVDGSVLGWI